MAATETATPMGVTKLAPVATHPAVTAKLSPMLCLIVVVVFVVGVAVVVAVVFDEGREEVEIEGVLVAAVAGEQATIIGVEPKSRRRE
jgi:hypothetical protein